MLVGASAQDLRATATFVLADSSRWLELFSMSAKSVDEMSQEEKDRQRELSVSAWHDLQVAPGY